MTQVPLDHLEYVCVGVICWCLLLLLFVTFSFSISCLAPSHKMDPQAIWRHGGKLFMAKREVVNPGWLSDAQSSKKLKGRWKKASSLGMHLSAKYSGAREPTFADTDIILPTVLFGKREEAAKTISDEKLRLLHSLQVFGYTIFISLGGKGDFFVSCMFACFVAACRTPNRKCCHSPHFLRCGAIVFRFETRSF